MSNKTILGALIILVAGAGAYYLYKNKPLNNNIPDSYMPPVVDYKDGNTGDYSPNKDNPADKGTEIPTAGTQNIIRVGKSNRTKEKVEYLTEVTEKPAPYGLTGTTVTAKTNTGKTETVVFAPSTYSKELGIGYDSKNQGYSSASPLDR
jgi:hypothetical protein